MRISSFFAAIVFPAAAIAFRDNNVLEFNHGINDFVQDFPSFSAGGNPEPKICWNLPGGKSILDYADISGTSALDFQSMPASGNCPRKLPHSCAAGIVCAKSVIACATEGSAVISAATKIYKLIQNEDFPKAIEEAKKLYTKVSQWPSCSSVSFGRIAAV